MRLAFCLYKFFPYGGLERDFLRIAEICMRRGHSVHVYAMVWEGDVPEGFELHLVPVRASTNHGRSRAFVEALRPLLAQGDYDAVVGFNRMPGLDVYYAADPCYVARATSTKPWYYRLTPRFRYYAACEKAVFSPGAGVELMMISAVEMERFIEYYDTPPERFHLLPPGIGRDRVAPPDASQIRADWRREFGVANREKVILMVGSAFKRKGLDRTLRGLAALPDSLRLKTRLIVIGKDDPKPFQRLASSLGVSDRIDFFLGRDDVPRFLLGADLFIHPAYSENTGTVILEAMVAGLPVLVTDTCGYAFHVTRAGAGKVVPSPYRQEVLDRMLEEMLATAAYADWSRNGIEYGRREDLYSLHEKAADVIEQAARKKSTVRSGNG